jgi:nucleotide-binding universal stress UspA family protein
MQARIVVGVDGSAHAQRAVDWCVEHASGMHAEVIAVHAIEPPGMGPAMGPYGAGMYPYSEDEIAAQRDVVERVWVKPLADAGIPCRVVVVEGVPARVLRETAKAEGADLLVVGSRGCGVVAEHLLGSTTHKLTHHLDRPLVIVP